MRSIVAPCGPCSIAPVFISASPHAVMLLARESDSHSGRDRRDGRDARRSADPDTAAVAGTGETVGLVGAARLRQPLARRSLCATVQARRSDLRALDAARGFGPAYGACPHRGARILQHLPSPAVG